MSEKIQRTAATMRESMNNRYNDGLYHKHNKCHLAYRKHWRSHPVIIVQLSNGLDQTKEINGTTGNIRDKNLKKTRLRIVKHNIH